MSTGKSLLLEQVKYSCTIWRASCWADDSDVQTSQMATTIIRKWLCKVLVHGILHSAKILTFFTFKLLKVTSALLSVWALSKPGISSLDKHTDDQCACNPQCSVCGAAS